jgi:hypothetical protein
VGRDLRILRQRPRAAAIGFTRVASKMSSQGWLSAPAARSARIIAAAVPLLIPQAAKPVATR